VISLYNFFKYDAGISPRYLYGFKGSVYPGIRCIEKPDLRSYSKATPEARIRMSLHRVTGVVILNPWAMYIVLQDMSEIFQRRHLDH